MSQLDAELQLAREAGKPAVLDLYADWCVSCKVMERNVFPQPEVAAGFEQFHLLRADVTLNDEEDQALLQAYGLFGPPSMIFFAEDGREITEFRVMGELDKASMEAHLKRLSEWVVDENVAESDTNVGEIASN